MQPYFEFPKKSKYINTRYCNGNVGGLQQFQSIGLTFIVKTLHNFRDHAHNLFALKEKMDVQD